MTDDPPENVCGSTDTTTGKPCRRPMGWGTESSIGPCRDHRTDGRTLRKLDEKTKQALIGAAETGAKHKHAAWLAGITPQTLRNWRNWAQEDLDAGIENELTDFYLRYRRARGAGAVRRLRDANDEFVLERSYGYTKKQEVEHSGAGSPFDLPESVTDEWVERGDE